MRTPLLSILALLLLPTAGLAAQPKTQTATFAGGCFWCMSPPFEKLEGVLSVLSGYTDGRGENPTYEDYGGKGYTEGVQVVYDPSKISYSQLLDVFWRNINPTDPNGQFVDRGPHYRAGIFYHNKEQRKLAEKSRKALDLSGRYDKPIVTPILAYVSFYKAEEYHQAYHDKNPAHYKLYRANSGRDSYLRKIWDKKSP